MRRLALAGADAPSTGKYSGGHQAAFGGQHVVGSARRTQIHRIERDPAPLERLAQCEGWPYHAGTRTQQQHLDLQREQRRERRLIEH